MSQIERWIWFVLLLVLAGAVFTIIRELICWYFKQSKIVEQFDKTICLQKLQIRLLAKLLARIAGLSDRELELHQQSGWTGPLTHEKQKRLRR